MRQGRCALSSPAHIPECSGLLPRTNERSPTHWHSRDLSGTQNRSLLLSLKEYGRNAGWEIKVEVEPSWISKGKAIFFLPGFAFPHLTEETCRMSSRLNTVECKQYLPTPTRMTDSSRDLKRKRIWRGKWKHVKPSNNSGSWKADGWEVRRTWNTHKWRHQPRVVVWVSCFWNNFVCMVKLRELANTLWEKEDTTTDRGGEP